MSIITTVEAVPSRVFAIYSTLYEAENGESRERLESWATPPSLSKRGADDAASSSTSLFTNSLNEARKLGLVEEVDGKLRLTSEARGPRKKGKDCEIFFRSFLNRTLFDPVRAAETQQPAFMIALSWFLSVNPLTPISFSEDPSFAIKAQMGDHARKTECTTLLNFQSFLYWARYLGFATIVGGRDAEDSSTRRVIPDPLRAIEGALPAIFADQDEMPVEQFFSRLAAIFPVFEQGVVRREYEAMRLSQSMDPQHLSIATSLALQRLADRQKIVIPQSIADAPAQILDFGIRQERVSHIGLRRAV